MVLTQTSIIKFRVALKNQVDAIDCSMAEKEDFRRNRGTVTRVVSLDGSKYLSFEPLVPHIRNSYKRNLLRRIEVD